jgi:hypothetical protein
MAVGVARFFSRPAGRWLRPLAGAATIVGWLTAWPPWAGIIGLFLLVVPAGDVCSLAPVFGGPIDGRRLTRI